MSRKNKRNYTFEKIEVTGAGSKGKSIAKAPDGRILLLSNAVPGDVVDVETHKKRKAYFEGKAIHFHTLSDKRVTPECQHFETCGGCKWQHMNYQSQLHYKQEEVYNNLLRIGGLDLPKPLPIIGSEKTYFYRNKMEFSFSNSRWLSVDEINSNQTIQHKNALGFHVSGMWNKVLDVEKCHLQAAPSNAIRNEIKKFATDHNLPFFDYKNNAGLLRTLMIRTSSTGQIMVVLQFYQNDTEKISLLMDFISQKFPTITSLQYCINQKANDVLYDQELIVYKGSDHIFEQMESLQFKINAKSFYQTNSFQAHELYKVVLDFADFKKTDLVYDLYTGIGTIAQFIASKVEKVVGVESVPEAIVDAKENANLNNVNNVEFYVGDMKTVFSESFIEKHGKPDVIVTDPPREGMHKKVVEQLLKVAPQKIVYVSCNSATQARDLALMKETYKVTKTQAVDMFPQTHHVENVVLLELRVKS